MSSLTSLPRDYELDNYTIIDTLGTGSFGITYRAQHKRLTQHVAIKEYFPREWATRETPPNHMVNPTNKDLFDRCFTSFCNEAENLLKLDHRNIVRFNHLFEANNTAYLVMPFIEGESLHNHIERYAQNAQTMPLQEILALAFPLLDALEYIHEKNLFHRDIKPLNVYLAHPDGSRDTKRPLLLDFGAARTFIPDKTLTVIGSSGYTPLEQWEHGNKYQGPWSDIHAFGATLYACYSGETPYHSQQRSSAVLNGRTDPLLDRIKELQRIAPSPKHVHFLYILSQCLCLRYEERIQNASKLRDKLCEIQSSDRPFVDHNYNIAKQTPFQKERIVVNIEELLQQAKSLYQNEKYDEAIPLLHTLAKQDNAEALYYLGKCYANGTGVNRDKREAFQYYTKAAEQGYALAEYMLGVFYYCGRLVPRDPIKSVEWFTRAAERGYRDAQYRVAEHHFFNTSLFGKSKQAAVEWYTKAAEQGHCLAQYRLGNCYFNGIGVTKDYQEAIKWYTKAAEQNHSPAKEELRKLNNFWPWLM